MLDVIDENIILSFGEKVGIFTTTGRWNLDPDKNVLRVLFSKLYASCNQLKRMV